MTYIEDISSLSSRLSPWQAIQGEDWVIGLPIALIGGLSP